MRPLLAAFGVAGFAVWFYAATMPLVLGTLRQARRLVKRG